MKYLILLIITKVYSYNCHMLKDYMDLYREKYYYQSIVAKDYDIIYQECVLQKTKVKCEEEKTKLKQEEKYKLRWFSIYKEMKNEYYNICK